MRKRNWFVFVIGCGVGYLVHLAVSAMSGHASIAISEICHSESEGGCIFRRVETTPGFDYTVTTTFFRSLREAKRGEYSTGRVECDPETTTDAFWRSGSFVIEADDGVCEFRGEAPGELRDIIQIHNAREIRSSH